ncbi:hypothetical protein Trydic_g9354 [Trypoxylus dichotomus]
MRVRTWAYWILFLYIGLLGLVAQISSTKLHSCTGRYRHLPRCQNQNEVDQQNIRNNYMEQNADEDMNFNQF